MSQSVEHEIQDLKARSAGATTIYRGQPEPYGPDGNEAISTLARIMSDGSTAADLAESELKILHSGLSFFTPHVWDIEAMADIRHFGGLVNFIDFSRNILVALFFACLGDPNKPGKLLLLQMNNERQASYRDYSRCGTSGPRTQEGIAIFEDIHTASNARRAVRQSSVLVHASSGSISFAKEAEHYTIPAARKPAFLEFLASRGIRMTSLFPDLTGFISSGIKYMPRTLEELNQRLDELLQRRAESARHNPYSLGRDHFFYGRYEEAVEALLVAKRQDSVKKDYAFHRLFGSTLLRVERHQETLEQLAQIPKEKWTDEDYYMSAIGGNGVGKFLESLVDIEESILQNSARSVYYIEMMSITAQAKKLDERHWAQIQHKELFRNEQWQDSPLGQEGPDGY